MANINKLNGLTPVASLISADWDGRGRIYAIPAAQTNQIAVGDAVKLVAGANSLAFPCVDIGAANGALVGVVIGLQNPSGVLRKGFGPYVDPTNLNQILVRPAAAQTADWYASVVDDPNVIFEIQEQTSSGAGTNFGISAATKTADLGRGAGAAAAPGWLSTMYLDNLNTGVPPNLATSNFRLIGLKQSIDNVLGAWQRWQVIINNHSFRSAQAGV